MQDGENEERYIWRLGRYKDSGLIDMSWDELADVINKETGNEDMPYSSAAYRKPYQQAKRFYEAGVFENADIEELKSVKEELEKERVKVRDERNELKRVIREEARKESYLEQVMRAVSEYSGKPLEYDESRRLEVYEDGGNDMVVSMTDLHTGIEIHNSFNTFDQDVLKQRLNHYLDRIFEIQERHRSENVCVILSELVSGLIHTPLRIENNQNLIEQFLTVTDYLSQFLTELSYRFEEVHVYICPGNHSRLVANKDNSLKGENIDHLAIPFLEAKLQNFENIMFHRNEVEESVAMFYIRGKLVMCSHGDKDDPGSVVQKFTLMFGIRPDIVYLGHRHTNGMMTVYDVKVIQSGSLSGSDSYCMDKRLKNKPEQTVSIITEDGLDCLYDIKFD